MKKAILILLAAAGAWAHGADPYVGYIYPCGIQAGTTNRLVVGGQFLWGVRTGAVSGGGVKIIDVELVPGFPPPTGSQFRYLAKWLDAIAKGDRTEPPLPTDPNARVDEWRSNRWWRVLGTLDEQKLAGVGLYAFGRVLAEAVRDYCPVNLLMRITLSGRERGRICQWTPGNV